MAGAVGFEPTHGGTKNRCLTAWLRPKESACTIKIIRENCNRLFIAKEPFLKYSLLRKILRKGLKNAERPWFHKPIKKVVSYFAEKAKEKQK